MPKGGKPIAAQVFPSGEADFSGEFRITYRPIMCVRAPCPAGDYVVASRDRTFNKLAYRIVVARPGKAADNYQGRRIGTGGLIVDGQVWLRDRIAYVVANRMREGRWNDE